MTAQSTSTAPFHSSHKAVALSAGLTLEVDRIMIEDGVGFSSMARGALLIYLALEPEARRMLRIIGRENDMGQCNAKDAISRAQDVIGIARDARGAAV